MEAFLTDWARAAHTTAGLFWLAFWAFALGYLVSSAIQSDRIGIPIGVNQRPPAPLSRTPLVDGLPKALELGRNPFQIGPFSTPQPSARARVQPDGPLKPAVQATNT
ncbi:MAG: hypothetical protein H6736_03725 [Alphaproteobacteria bacterium]|nr:hypothetical protein [Alphaproteobacteria bacterium]